MSKIYCVGDIHGCSATLEDLLLKKISLQKSDKLIFIGDYIDRGKDSKGVIDIILNLFIKKFDVTCLLGNHEEMFIDSFADDDIYEHWVTKCGGNFTLNSFNITTYDELDEKYLYFFKTLLHYHTLYGKYIFVHAGLNFSRHNLFEDKYSLLWKRDTTIDYEKLGDRTIIHGHTPQPFEETQSQLNHIHQNKIVNVDNGCVFAANQNLGQLTAVELTEMKLYSVFNQE
jgi:serine/threonine protein phosphatase 1